MPILAPPDDGSIDSTVIIDTFDEPPADSAETGDTTSSDESSWDDVVIIDDFGGGFDITPEDPVDDPPPPEDPVDETPLPDDPVDETPLPDDPVDETPLPEDPVDETPLPDDPVDETPLPEDPVDETPLPEDPVDETPLPEDPVDETPPPEDPVDETPLPDDPVDETPLPDDPVDETPVDDPVDDVPPPEDPVDETPVDDPVDDVPPPEDPVDETPVDDPVDDVPPPEDPVDETPVDDPVDDVPPPEDPVDETPVDDPVDEEPPVDDPVDEVPPVDDPVDEDPLPDPEPPVVPIDPFEEALRAYVGDGLNGRNGPFLPIGFDLSLLYFEYQVHGEGFATDPEYLYLQKVLRGEQIVTLNGSVVISVVAAADAASPQQDLENLGAVAADNDNIFLPIDSLNELAALTWVQDVTTFYQPVTVDKVSLTPLNYPDDPLFFDQWHLDNRGQTGGLVGEDANVLEVWDEFRGTGVTIGIVDEGVDHTHPDLINNYDASLSFDFNDLDFDPAPTVLTETHGTSVAGVAAGDGFNFQGISGAAPDATLAGLRLIASPVGDVETANALSWASQQIDIYNNSWRMPTVAIGVIAPALGQLSRNALSDGVINGRGGLGNIYVFAGGNGQANGGNVNYLEYQNSRYTIAVAAIDHNGFQATYSNPGAALLVSAHSEGGRGPIPPDGITTTTIQGVGNVPGNPDYRNNFNGTSSSAPLASGVIALMLEANPSLTWRDVQHILVNSSRRNHSFDGDWTQNGAGQWVNHKYGHGAVDARRAVALAKVWQNVAPEVTVSSRAIIENAPLEDLLGNVTDVVSSFTFDSNHDITIESVEIVVNIRAAFRGDIEVILTSPDGTQSVLAEPRLTDPGVDYTTWTFTSMRHWGERTAGTWTLSVRDAIPGLESEFAGWEIQAYGTGEVPPPLPPGWTEEL